MLWDSRGIFDRGINKVKYYGLKQKRFKEDILYSYAKKRTKILSICSRKQREFWKKCYQNFNEEDPFIVHRAERTNNSIPENGEINLDHLIISDLIRREDIRKLQSGVRYMLRNRRSGKFVHLRIEGVEEICKRIEKMDSTLV